MSVREASHAGSWYSDSAPSLTKQLDQWLSQVPEQLPGIGPIPVSGARAVIVPHAGYAYSGHCAAWAYKCLNLSQAKRIFILHPSHHHHLATAALPSHEAYATPLSRDPLPIDLETVSHLATLTTVTSQSRTVRMVRMSLEVDEREHSAEMQLPYLHRLLQLLYPDQPPSAYPPLVPIMVGGTSSATEAALGKMLAPYIADPENAFVISSDFCHWGSRFDYTYYLPDAPSPALSPLSLPNGVNSGSASPSATDVHLLPTLSQGHKLSSYSKSFRSRRGDPRISESIAHADRACMCAIATGKHSELLRVLVETGNTVCGRHPIGVFMAGVEEAKKLGNIEDGKGVFRFVRYERSSDVANVGDSSVSYVSGFAEL